MIGTRSVYLLVGFDRGCGLTCRSFLNVNMGCQEVDFLYLGDSVTIEYRSVFYVYT